MSLLDAMLPWMTLASLPLWLSACAPKSAGPGPAPAPLDRGPAVEFWHRDLGAGVGGQAALADGIVYAGDAAGTLHAIEARSGRVLYDQPLRSDAFVAITAPPVVLGDLLILTDAGGQVSAVRRADGVARWTVTLDGPVRAPPVARQDSLWVAAEGYGIFRLDAATGAERWRRIDQQAWSSLVATEDGGLCARGGSDPEGNGLVLCLDADSGRERWRQYFGLIDQRPLVALPGGPLLGTRDGSLERYNAQGLVARQSAAGPRPHSPPLVTEDRLWVADGAGSLRAFSPDDLHQILEIPLGFSVAAGPVALCGDVAVADASGAAHGYDARTGQRTWQSAVTLSAPGAPVGLLATDNLIILASDNTVRAISPPSCDATNPALSAPR